MIATDTASSPLTGVGTIKIKIIDINEPPTYSDPGEFSVKEIDVLTKLDTIASVNNKKVLCEELKRKHSGFFTWFDPTCELETTGEQVGSIVLRDVDANSRLTISIQKIVAKRVIIMRTWHSAICTIFNFAFNVPLRRKNSAENCQLTTSV